MYGYSFPLKKRGESVPAAPANLVQPSLSGTGAVGSNVVCNPGAWSGVPTPTFTYDFKVNGVSVQNSSSDIYVPTSIDETGTLTCLVTATNSQGSASEGTSNSIVIGSAPSNTVAPTLSPSGTQSTGTVITVSAGTWSGTAPITYDYQWYRGASPISGQTASTYTIQVADDGTTITCQVRGNNAYGTSAYVATSNSVSAVNSAAPVNTVAPVISGTTTLGSTLTTTDGTWTGIPTPTFTYQWYRGASPISGATSTTYVTTLADSTANITCQVTATNTAGSATATSNTITLPSYAPVNTVAPVISGTAVVGQTLTTTNGTWTNSPSSYSYQWKRGATNIGTNSSSYTLVQADAGNTSNITCVVTATNSAGSANATSNTIARILDTLTNNYITGLTLTSAEIDSFNTLYLDLRANNFHTEIDTLQIYSTATSAASTKPLIGSQTVTLVNSPTFTRKVGYTMTGTSYIDSGFAQTGSTKFQINNNCFGFGVANKNTTTTGVTGFLNGNITWVVLTSNVVCGNQNSGTQGPSLFTRTISNQDYATRRNNNANRNGFQDGTELNGALASTSPTINTRTMFVGAGNNGGTPTGIYESGSVVKYLYTGSYNIDPAIMRTIINNFISSL